MSHLRAKEGKMSQARYLKERKKTKVVESSASAPDPSVSLGETRTMSGPVIRGGLQRFKWKKNC